MGERYCVGCGRRSVAGHASYRSRSFTPPTPSRVDNEIVLVRASREADPSLRLPHGRCPRGPKSPQGHGPVLGDPDKRASFRMTILRLGGLWRASFRMTILWGRRV